jgi:UDP:flavonoid glycosyltransferase YjiC (YdhE family)
MWYSFLGQVNNAAKYFKVKPYKPLLSFFKGETTLVAEPAEFTGTQLQGECYFIGPLLANENFKLPDELKQIPKNKPLIYFAMGSSGVARIVENIIQGFEGKPYYVIAPVKHLLNSGSSIKIPDNVYITDWLPALQVNKMTDLALIHGGVGTVLTAALAGKPVVGIGMQPEQVENIQCLVRKGIAIRYRKDK